MTTPTTFRSRQATWRPTLALVVAIVLLGGCSLTADDTEPVGIGSKTDEFRESPCACNEIAPQPVNDDYLKRLQRRLAV